MTLPLPFPPDSPEATALNREAETLDRRAAQLFGDLEVLGIYPKHYEILVRWDPDGAPYAGMAVVCDVGELAFEDPPTDQLDQELRELSERAADETYQTRRRRLLGDDSKDGDGQG